MTELHYSYFKMWRKQNRTTAQYALQHVKGGLNTSNKLMRQINTKRNHSRSAKTVNVYIGIAP